MFHHFFLLLSFLSLTFISQAQVSNKFYYEIIDSMNHLSFKPNCLSLDSSLFLINTKEEKWNSYLIDENGNKTTLPCDKVKVRYLNKDYRCFQCLRDTMSAAFSMETKSPITPFYRNMFLEGPNYYSVFENDSLYFYNIKQELLYKRPKPNLYFEAKVEDYLDSNTSINEDGIVSLFDDERTYYFNASGKLTQDEVDRMTSKNFSDGSYTFRRDNKTGLKTKDGTTIIEPQYGYFKEWRERKYIVEINKRFQSDRRYRLIDQFNNNLLPGEYTSMSGSSLGLEVSTTDCKRRFLNEDLIDIYDKAFDRLLVVEVGLIIPKIGEEVFYDLPYGKNFGELKSGVLEVEWLTDNAFHLKYKNGKSVLINPSGEVIFKINDESVSFKRNYHNLIEVSTSKTCGLLKDDGKWIVEPGDFSFKVIKDVAVFYRKNISQKRTDLFNIRGELLYPDVNHGHIVLTGKPLRVRRKNKLGVISPEGKLIIPFDSHRIKGYKNRPNFYLLTKNNKSYLVKLKE